MKFLKESTDIFYVGKTEVIKNPTDTEYRQLWQEQRDRIKYYEPGEPLIRITYDNQGNEYVWPAYDSTHYYIENEIRKKYNVKVNQAKNFNLDEAYLDKENKFYDYGTKEITKWITPDLPYSSEIFDTSTLGGYSYYNKYMKDKSNIKMITPKEYFEKAAEGFNTSIETQIKNVENDSQIIKHLKDVIFKYHKSFPMPYISKNNGSKQEGRHRVYVFADLYGWNKTFPCLITEEY